MTTKSNNKKAVRVFCSYSHRDELLRVALDKHLAFLQRNGIVSNWSDRKIEAGAKWAVEISTHLESADVILLLVSADFMASDYCYGIEMQRALHRCNTGDARVIPIIVRPVDWQAAPFANLQVLPRDAKPVTSWDDPDEAWASVATTIRLLCEEILAEADSSDDRDKDHLLQQPKQVQTTYQLSGVFVKSGMPNITLVERDEFDALKVAIATLGRGVVIEGPSGVGKTTAVRQVLAEVGQHGEPFGRVRESLLTARKPDDVKALTHIEKWHRGMVVIDDFHRLELPLKLELVNYLKRLADEQPHDRKLIIIGIPGTGQRLVDLSHDVSTRIDVFRFGKVSDQLVLSLIRKGEDALNIEFDRKVEIAIASSGSLNIAQYLGFEICMREHVLETSSKHRYIRTDLGTAVSRVGRELSAKFHDPIRQFAALGPRTDTTCLELLKELPHTDDGFLSLPALPDRRPALAAGINSLIDGNWIHALYAKYPDVADFIYYDESARALVAEDPQLTFYLNNANFARLADEAGKYIPQIRKRLTFVYSHVDAEWLEKIRIHLKSAVNEADLELWSDSRAQATAKWADELQHVFGVSAAVIILVSADFLASEFALEQRLYGLLATAHANGTTIVPLIVSPCLYRGSSLNVYLPYGLPDRPLTAMREWEQDKTLLSLTETILKRLKHENK